MSDAGQSDIPADVVLPGAGRRDYSMFVAALDGVLHAPPESWSHSEIDRLVSTLGWSAPPMHRPEGVGIAVYSDEVDITLWADATNDGIDPERWGFGEFCRISLWQTLSGNVTTTAYRAALQSCVEVLGPPSLVGGPGPFAIWRGPRTTFTLSGGSGLSLDIEPTEPTEEFRHWQWRWSDDWSADDAWMVVPNVRGVRFGLPTWWHPEPQVSTWAKFEEYLDDLVHSLLTDLPLLQPYATEITFSLSVVASKSVQCWFGPDVVRVGTWRSGDSDWTTTTFPTGPESARVAGEAIRTAVRGLNVASPTDLSLHASCLTGRQRLATIRLGVPEQRRIAVLSPPADPIADLAAEPAAPPTDWSAFTPRLALVLRAMPDYGVIIISAPDNRFAQFVRVGGTLAADISLEVPDETGHWHREILVDADPAEYLELAGLVTHAFSRTLRIQLPTDLEVSAFSNGLDCFDPETAALGIRYQKH